MAMLKFKKGLWSKLPETMSEGTIYVTTDEKAMYVDISDSKRIRLGDIVRLAKMSDLTPPYSTEPFYYIEEDNALLKYVEVKNAEGTVTGHAWKQVNGTQDLQTAITKNASDITALDERLTDLDKTGGRIAAIESRVTAIDADKTGRMAVAEADIAALKATVGTNEEGETIGGRVTAIEGRMDDAEDAIEALESKDGELAEAIEGVKGLLTQHETTAGQTYATKTELANAKSAVLGQTEGIDFVGTVKEAYAKIEAETARADAAEKANASAASAASQAAADADAKAVQAGKDAAKAQKAAEDAQAAAELRVLSSDFEAFKTTNSAAIKAADDKAVSAGNAASAIQEEFDAYELAHANDYNNGKIDELVADAKKAGTDANDNANTRLLKSEFETFKSGNTTAIEAAQSAANAAGSAAEAAQGTANQAVLDAKAAKELAETKATLDEVKGLNYATKTEAQGYADAKDTAIQAAHSAANDAQADADLNTAAIAKLNGAVTEAGSVAKIADDARKAAEAKAAELAGAAETAAKGYADGIVDPVSKVANAAKTAAEKNAEDIATLNGADTVEGSVDFKVKAAKEALTTEINSKINAANAMVYRGEVSNAMELAALSELSVGDTYVVSSSFGAYNAGDLLVANGKETNNVITEDLTWDHVTTGYDADLEQTIETVDGKIQLTSGVGSKNNGQISFVSDGSAATVSVASNTVTIGMAWEDFE